MAVQGAFWISSRAGGIDDDRWVVRGAIWPLKAVAGLLQKCIEGEAPGRRTSRARYIDVLEVRQPILEG